MVVLMIDQVAVGKLAIPSHWKIELDIFCHSYRCNQTGHLARDCPSDSSQSVCYNCNQPGKLLSFRNIWHASYSSFLPGHISRDCPEPRANNFGSGGFRGSRGM